MVLACFLLFSIKRIKGSISRLFALREDKLISTMFSLCRRCFLFDCPLHRDDPVLEAPIQRPHTRYSQGGPKIFSFSFKQDFHILRWLDLFRELSWIIRFIPSFNLYISEMFLSLPNLAALGATLTSQDIVLSFPRGKHSYPIIRSKSF